MSSVVSTIESGEKQVKFVPGHKEVIGRGPAWERTVATFVFGDRLDNYIVTSRVYFLGIQRGKEIVHTYVEGNFVGSTTRVVA